MDSRRRAGKLDDNGRRTLVISELLIAIAIAIAVYAIVIFNRLVTDSQRCKSGWSDIEVQLKRRHELIPKLVAAVKQYAGYEQATLENVTRLRSEATRTTTTGQLASLESGISSGLASILALQESYPELKADQNFLQLQQDISLVEADIQLARRYYNGAVRNLNTRIDSFPDMIIARFFNYHAASYFEFKETAG